MKKIILLACLGLIGCVTVATESKPLPRTIQQPAPTDAAEMDKVISIFSEVIKKSPNDAGAHYNRAMAYFYKKDYDQCWQDVYRAEFLGYSFSADFIAELEEVSHRIK